MKLYVGNLPYTTTDDELQQLFAQYGTVASARVIINHDTKQSKGFGFVEFDNDDEAKAAIDALNGKDFSGRNLKVNEARPQGERPPRREGGNGDFSSFRQRSW